MAPFSMDLRKRVVAFVEAGHSKKEASGHFHVSDGFVKKLFARLRTAGTLEPGHPPGAMPKLNESQQHKLTEMVRQQPDATLAELRDQIREVCGVELSVSGVAVSAAQTTRVECQKKSQRAAEQDREDVARARGWWRLNQSRLDPRRLVFLDETGLSTAMARRYGRALRGERLVAPIPPDTGKRSRWCRPLTSTASAQPCCSTDRWTGASFTGCCEWLLAQVLRPGEWSILDNLSRHKSKTARAAIQGAGADVLDLPSYSPDLKPIENVFSKVKALFRSAAAPMARTLRDRWQPPRTDHHLRLPQLLQSLRIPDLTIAGYTSLGNALRLAR